MPLEPPPPSLIPTQWFWNLYKYITERGTLIQGANVTLTGTLENRLSGPGDVTISASSGGGGVTDGDKGDIVVSGTGTVWTVDALAITDSKVATANKDGASATASMRTLGTGAAQACAGNDARLSDARTPLSHVHGNITNGGLVGVTANLPLITGTAGIVQAGSFGTGANTFCQGSDSRLSDARTPLSHTHGNITNGGLIGITANLPIITGTAGILQAGSFGTGANTFCQGSDTRLADDRTASGVRTATTVVSVSGAAAPSSGQVLTATSSTAATWQTPAGGSAPTGVLSDIQFSVLQSDGTLNAALGVQTWGGTNKTAQDVFTVAANSTYRVRGKWILNTGATTHTTAMAWALTTATATDFQYLVNLWSAALNTLTTTQSTVHVSGVASKVLNATSTAVYTIIDFEGILVIGTGGTITPQINFSANPTGTNLMKRGSWTSFERLGTDTITLAGGWA